MRQQSPILFSSSTVTSKSATGTVHSLGLPSEELSPPDPLMEALRLLQSSHSSLSLSLSLSEVWRYQMTIK